MNKNCPLRVLDWRKDEAIPICPVGNCTHVLARDEKVCPCHTPTQNSWKLDFEDLFLDLMLQEDGYSVEIAKLISFISNLIKKEREAEKERIHKIFKKEVPPHGLDKEDAIWLKRILNKVFSNPEVK